MFETDLSVTPLMGHGGWFASYWSVPVVFMVGILLVFLKPSRHLKTASTLTFCVDEKQKWAALPINCSKIGHSYEAFTYLPVWSKYLHSSPVSKHSTVDSAFLGLGLRLFIFFRNL